MSVDYFGFLRPRSQTRITTVWGNALVDVLNMLYGRTVGGTFDSIQAVYGSFSEALYVAGRPVLKDGDPITVADIGDDARSKITQAIGSALSRFPDNAVVVDMRGAEKVYRGTSFTASKRFTDVANNAVVEVIFINPSNSGKNAILATVELASLGNLFLDIFTNVTVTSPGTPLISANLNLGSTVSNVAAAYHGGSYSYTDQQKRMEVVVPGGMRQAAVGFISDVGERAIIPPGSNILVKITNVSGATTSFSIRFVWWEE